MEYKNEEMFLGWVTSFHKLRIQGFLSIAESNKIWKRICKIVNKAGYQIVDVGFYEWKFPKIDK